MKNKHIFAKKRFKIIMDTIWSSETIVGDRTIDVYIRKIREILVDMKIETIKGIGYKLCV
jgi:two-component system, OmpR family, alkaline phosphatase synthesis response regulator PhoP